MKFEVMYQDQSKKVIDAENVNLASVKAKNAKKRLNAILTINEIKADDTKGSTDIKKTGKTTRSTSVKNTGKGNAKTGNKVSNK
jgi:uncharacterized membrane protein YdfJ with MMPL/SSD domain